MILDKANNTAILEKTINFIVLKKPNSKILFNK